MKFDDLLDYLGAFGPYQRRLYILMNLTSICIAFQTLVPVFILYVPDHRCELPSYTNDTFAIQSPRHADLVNMSIPPPSENVFGKYAQCVMYDTKSSNHISVTCDAWVYDKSEIDSTIATDLNLVCSRKQLRSHGNMALMAGKLVAALLQGISSDYFGRKKTFIVCMMMLVTAGFANVFIYSFATLILFRFMAGLTTTSTFMSAFVIGIEFVGPSKRKLAGIGIQFFWQIGMYLMVLLAYFIRDWRHLLLALAVPAVFYIPLTCFVRESPRWLLTKGRKEEAEAIIQEAARYNKVTLPEKVTDEGQELLGENEKKETIWKLFSSRTLAFRSFFIFINWAVCSMVYYGITLNISNMNGDIYINFFLGATLEGLGNLLCWVLLDRMGRKKFYITSLMIGGVACGSSIIPLVYYKHNAETTLMVLSWIGRMGVTAAYSTLYIYTAEMFPTILRNSGLGAGSLVARIGGIVSPYIADVGLYFGGIYEEGLPFIVFSACALVAATMALTFPETLNRKLPDTIEEAKSFSRTGKLKHQL